MQKIELHHFGPLQHLSIEVNDFMLLIGPQAGGKSTIAKTIYFFKSLNDDLVKYFAEAINTNDFSKTTRGYAKMISQKFLNYFGDRHRQGLHLKYYYTDNVWIEITLPKNKKYVTPRFSTDFQKAFQKLVKEADAYTQSFRQKNPSLLTSKELSQLDEAKNQYINHIKSKCHAIFQEDRELIFIPAGRSLLATLSEQLSYVNLSNLDFWMQHFLNKINIVRPIFNKSPADIIRERKALSLHPIEVEKAQQAEEIITSILKGKYQHDRDGEKIYFSADNYVKLGLASSGQQESLWILLLLFLVVLERQNVFMVIEEPEAHLFPEAQRAICHLVALVANTQQSQVIVTTHSPYVAASFNNLILAEKTGAGHEAEVGRHIPKNLWLNSEKVFAGIVQNGTVENIIDPELHIIQQERIDTVSQQINQDFDFLFQFETV
jgi:predicted ATP-dependent endonuclease of OLD family